MENFNPEFLNKKFNLHNTPEVKSALERKEKRSRARHDTVPEKVSHKPAETIQNYLNRFKEILDRKNTKERQKGIEALKRVLYRTHVIKKENIPESTFLLEQRIAEERGFGKIEITKEFKEEKTKEIINTQKRSLDAWIEYITSQDADDAGYPDWARYWAFRSVTEMGKLVKKEDEEGNEKARFKKRTKDTVAPFLTMNPRAFAATVSIMKSRLDERSKPKNERNVVTNTSNKLNDEEFQKLLSTENFSKIYIQFLIEMPEYSTEGLQEIRGKWVTYEKGTDPKKLIESLEGYPLEWCTAEYDVAKTQLQNGDLYIFYSLNQYNEAKIPRVAIRMEENHIAEVRGIAYKQNIDPYITPVIDEKMKDFGSEADLYNKKSRDMKKMTEIHEKHKNKKELSQKDLRFLYEIDEKIKGFGYADDPRIQEVIEGRNKRSDIAKVMNVSPDEISFTREEALSGGIKYHYGDLNLSSLTSAEGLELPKSVGEDLYLRGLTTKRFRHH